MVVDIDGMICGVSHKHEDHELPFILCTLADPRGQSMSVRLTGTTAQAVAQALMEASTVIHDSEDIYRAELEMQQVETTDRLGRYE